jgi:hypothetical protein
VSRPDQALVGWCVGKDCRRDGAAATRRLLEQHCTIVELPCLDVCSGPIAVIDPTGDRPVVLRKVRSKKVVTDLVDHVVDAAPMSDRLRQRQVAGAKRDKARRRIARALR